MNIFLIVIAFLSAYLLGSVATAVWVGKKFHGIDVRELLKPCRAGITIYADRTKFLTVYNRLVFFLNQIAEASLPVARWGVYLEQGTVASEFGIESDDVVAVNEQGMADFLGGL